MHPHFLGATRRTKSKQRVILGVLDGPEASATAPSGPPPAFDECAAALTRGNATAVLYHPKDDEQIAADSRTIRRDLARGIEPPATDGALDFTRIYGAERILAPGQDWRDLGTDKDPIFQVAEAAAS
jgi:hypothetical protein